MSIHYDILIIGAGVSGIGIACHLAKQCPTKSVQILERRKSLGGTWDLFRYPGIRSDSDMLTFSYKFRPWKSPNILAEGESIKSYVTDTAKEYGVEKKISYGLKVIAADWSSQNKLWTITAQNEEKNYSTKYTCKFLISATGYYDYDEGYLPEFQGISDFSGVCVHPQHWPEDLEYRNKRIIVIGSGATAVTLVPNLAKDAENVIMLQRSPSYIYSLPTKDTSIDFFKKIFSENLAYKISWERNIKIQRAIFNISKKFPNQMRKFLLKRVKKQLGTSFDLNHFTPKYMPWDERLCAVPKGDLFKAIANGNASIVTDHIDRFTKNGILLKSGKELKADIIVTATGLKIQMLGGLKLIVDKKEINFNEKLSYKGALVQDVPNFAFLFGYTNLSWTVKIDMLSEYICRLINEMDSLKAIAIVPYANSREICDTGILDSLSSGYLQRGKNLLPRQGKSENWCVTNHLESDRKILKKPILDSDLKWLFRN